jgi:hypothetical protein
VVPIFGSGYVDGSVQIYDSPCIMFGLPIGADAIVAYF